MPYRVEHRDGQWDVIKKSTGKVVSRHDSKTKANESIRAVYAHEHGTGTGSGHWFYKHFGR